MRIAAHYPVLDGLFAATRTAELVNEETQSGWQDAQGRIVRQKYLNNLLAMHEALPDQLSAVLHSVSESDLILQKSRDTYHLYGQSESAYSLRLAESSEERHRSFSCSDLSRSRCNASTGFSERAKSLINHAYATSLNF